MKVDNILILAAGKGSRMGNIGNALPKVLWPVFNHSILELEVLYAEKFNPKNIFINSFYHHNKMKKAYGESKVLQKAELIEEKEILDIGGAIHNIAHHLDYSGNLLVLNSDQFIFLNHELWKESFKHFKESDHLIFSYDVSSNELYNGLEINGNKLVGITPNEEFDRDTKVQTYTGMSLINLNKLEKNSGESKFFKTVADFNSHNICVQNIKQSHYWDFGTPDRYWKSMFNIIDKDSDDMFIEFLNENHVYSKSLIKNGSYNSNAESCINLCHDELGYENSIILKSGEGLNKSKLKTKERKIVYEDIILPF